MAILSNTTELEEDVRGIINEATASFWSSDFILRQLEKGHQIVSSKIKLVHTIWTAILIATTPSAGYAQITDDREIRLPSGFISIDTGGVYYNDDTCAFTTIGVLKEDKDWLDRTGTPHQYYLRGDMLGFDKQITATDTVRIYGTKIPTELSASQAPWDGDYRTVGYRSLLVDYAVGMCLKKKKDPEWRAYLTPKVGSFWLDLEDMKEELLVNGDEDCGMVSVDNPTHTYEGGSFPDYSQFD